MTTDAPVFDPAQPFEDVTSPSPSPSPSAPQFDPTQSFEDVTPPPPQTSENGADYLKTLVDNIPSSAANFVSNVARPVLHPSQTLESIGGIEHGLLQKAGIESGTDAEQYPDAIGKMLIDRYGSLEKFKNTVRDDPVGVVADLSTVFTGGGALAAKLPGMAGKIGETLSAAGNATNPLAVVGKGVSTAAKAAAPFVGKIVPDIFGAAGPRVSGESLRTAAQYGYEGGETQKSLTANMRGTVPPETLVDNAKAALQQMRLSRQGAYRSGMTDISKDKTILDFKPLWDKVNETEGVKVFKGKDLSPKTADVRGEIHDTFRDWQAADPAEYHTPEGFDALKQKVGDIRDSYEYGTPQRLVADNAYHAVWDAISKQAPAYAGVMKDYEAASNQLNEIQKTLSLGNKSTIDAALSKLQSALKSGPRYGRRQELLQALADSGAPQAKTIVGQVAGQNLSPWITPDLVASGIAMGGFHFPMAWPLLALKSPRLAGEAALAAGRAARYASKVPKGLIPNTGLATYQAGKISGLGQPMEYTPP